MIKLDLFCFKKHNSFVHQGHNYFGICLNIFEQLIVINFAKRLSVTFLRNEYIFQFYFIVYIKQAKLIINCVIKCCNCAKKRFDFKKSRNTYCWYGNVYKQCVACRPRRCSVLKFAFVFFVFTYRK